MGILAETVHLLPFYCEFYLANIGIKLAPKYLPLFNCWQNEVKYQKSTSSKSRIYNTRVYHISLVKLFIRFINSIA